MNLQDVTVIDDDKDRPISPKVSMLRDAISDVAVKANISNENLNHVNGVNGVNNQFSNSNHSQINKDNTQKEQSQPFGIINTTNCTQHNTQNNYNNNTAEPHANKNSQPLTSLRGGNEMSDVPNTVHALINNGNNNMSDNCTTEPNHNDGIDPMANQNNNELNMTESMIPSQPVPEPKTWSINPINSIMTYEYAEDAKTQSLKDHLLSVEKGFDSIKDLFAEMYRIDGECTVLVSG